MTPRGKLDEDAWVGSDPPGGRWVTFLGVRDR